MLACGVAASAVSLSPLFERFERSLHNRAALPLPFLPALLGVPHRAGPATLITVLAVGGAGLPRLAAPVDGALTLPFPFDMNEGLLLSGRRRHQWGNYHDLSGLFGHLSPPLHPTQAIACYRLPPGAMLSPTDFRLARRERAEPCNPAFRSQPVRATALPRRCWRSRHPAPRREANTAPLVLSALGPHSLPLCHPNFTENICGGDRPPSSEEVGGLCPSPTKSGWRWISPFPPPG